MLKHYLLALLLMVFFCSSAQIKKGSILLGGQLFYYNDKNETDNFTQSYQGGSIGVSVGKAYKENRVAGFTIAFSPSKQDNIRNGNDTFNLNYHRFDIGVFLREYKRLAKDFYFFGQIDAAFITSNQKEDYKRGGDLKATQKGGFISLTPGISYQVFTKMQLELTIPNILGLQYLVTKIDSQNLQVQSSKRKQMSFYSNVNNNTSLGWLGVGFRFIF
jgi:hypothetical protein